MKQKSWIYIKLNMEKEHISNLSNKKIQFLKDRSLICRRNLWLLQNWRSEAYFILKESGISQGYYPLIDLCLGLLSIEPWIFMVEKQKALTLDGSFPK